MAPKQLSDADLVDAFAHVQVDHDNKAFYRAWTERRLVFNRCNDCHRYHNPPRPMCPSCWSWNIGPAPVSGRGVVHLLIRLHQGPPAPGVDYGAGPYPVVSVELEEQSCLRFTSTVINCDPASVHIGMPVELAWIERYGQPFPVFQPRSA